MSVYESKNIYPDITSILATAPEDVDQVYRLKHIQYINVFLNSEIIERLRLYKKFHRCELVAHYIENGLITGGVIAGGGSIAALCTGVRMPLSIVLGELSIGASIATSITK